MTGNAARMLVSTNPATGEKVGEVALCDEAEVRAILARARAAQEGWSKRPLKERCRIIRRFAKILLERQDEVAKLVVAENGKTLQEAFGTEILSVVDIATYYGKQAPRVLATKRIWPHLVMHKQSELVRVPRGVVLVISPWNFPFSIPFGTVLLALLAGNAVVLKPASLTPLIALKGRELLLKAGVPDDVFQVAVCGGALASKMIEMRVDYVNFTGSTEVGTKVAELCGRQLIPCSMELGGKDPAIVCADADLERAANGVVWGAFANCGQICASVERALVHRSIYDRFVDMVVERTKRLRQGPPEKGEVDVGAMTDPGQLEIVVRQVEAARQGGAKILTGGVRPEGPGQFYPPTVISTEDDTLDVVRDESFGPLLPILPFDNEEEAIRRANDSPYGLVASVWTKDVERGRKIARRLVTGTVIINDVLYTHAIAELPWFGAKHSGMGVVHSDDGLLALTRTVHVNYGMISLGNREPSWYPYTEKTTKFLKNTLQAAATAKLRHLAKVARGFLG